MSFELPTIASWVVKGGFAVLVANELRGLILAGPVLYGAYQAGGTLMAIWLAISSLAGIAASVFGPVFAWKKIKPMCERWAARVASAPTPVS